MCRAGTETLANNQRWLGWVLSVAGCQSYNTGMCIFLPDPCQANKAFLCLYILYIPQAQAVVAVFL